MSLRSMGLALRLTCPRKLIAAYWSPEGIHHVNGNSCTVSIDGRSRAYPFTSVHAMPEYTEYWYMPYRYYTFQNTCICEHNRKQCGGLGICEHNRIRSKCKDCRSVAEINRSLVQPSIHSPFLAVLHRSESTALG